MPVHCLRRARADCICSGDWGLLECRGRSWRPLMPSPKKMASASVRWGSSLAAFPLLTGRDRTDWLEGPARSWDTCLTQWRWWNRGGWCHLSWTTSPTPCGIKFTITAQGSSFSKRLIHPKCLKETYHRSFLPAAAQPALLPVKTIFTTIMDCGGEGAGRAPSPVPEELRWELLADWSSGLKGSGWAASRERHSETWTHTRETRMLGHGTKTETRGAQERLMRDTSAELQS